MTPHLTSVTYRSFHTPHPHRQTCARVRVGIARCDCGWQGPIRVARAGVMVLRREVVADELAHRAEVDVA